jgi:hypothetical protein
MYACRVGIRIRTSSNRSSRLARKLSGSESTAALSSSNCASVNATKAYGEGGAVQPGTGGHGTSA